MVWACNSAQGVGNTVFIDSTMNKDLNLSILKKNLPSNVKKNGYGKKLFFVSILQ